MDSLPQRVVAKVERLARLTGQTPAAVVEEAIDLYDKQVKAEASGEALAEIIRDPKKRAVYKSVMSALGKRGSAKLTREERKTRAQAGAAARAEKLTPKQRSDQARKAAKALWKQRAEESEP